MKKEDKDFWREHWKVRGYNIIEEIEETEIYWNILVSHPKYKTQWAVWIFPNNRFFYIERPTTSLIFFGENINNSHEIINSKVLQYKEVGKLRIISNPNIFLLDSNQNIRQDAKELIKALSDNS